jgi:hypothetical protein
MVPAVAVKVVVLKPCAIVTVVGTVRDAVLLETAVAAPPVPAACESVKVQVAAAPEVRLDGVQERELRITPLPLTVWPADS